MSFSCTCCVHKLTKITNKNLKIFTHLLLILFHLCIKFQIQIHYSLAITKIEISDKIISLDLS
jgi:hypothetical protein